MAVGPDLGRCFLMNLRTGMMMACVIQSCLWLFFVICNFNWMMSQTLTYEFFFFREIVANSTFIVYFITGSVAIPVGIIVNVYSLSRNLSPTGKRTHFQLARLWMWLCLLMIPTQFFYGCFFSFQCIQLVSKTTPTLLVMDFAFQEAMKELMPIGSLGAGTASRESAVTMLTTLFVRKSDANRKAEIEQELRNSNIEYLDEDKKPDEKTTWAKITSKFTHFGKYFADSYEWWMDQAQKHKRTMKFALIAATLIACLIIRSIFNEAQLVMSWLPYPLNDLYWWGTEFFLAFLLFAFIPSIIHSVTALHVGGFAAVLQRGGTGDEFVGWKHLRWFYNLPARDRRAVMAGALKQEMRVAPERGGFPSSEDSTEGSEFEEIINRDRTKLNLLSARRQRATSSRQ